MLIVLGAGPGAAPVEAMLEEEAVAEIAAHYLVGEVAAPVDVRRAGCRFYDARTRGCDAIIGIVERVDIDCLAIGMF